jgi:hypothetical protein
MTQDMRFVATASDPTVRTLDRSRGALKRCEAHRRPSLRFTGDRHCTTLHRQTPSTLTSSSPTSLHNG